MGLGLSKALEILGQRRYLGSLVSTGEDEEVNSRSYMQRGPYPLHKDMFDVCA